MKNILIICLFISASASGQKDSVFTFPLKDSFFISGNYLYDSLGYGRLTIDKPKRDTVKAIMMISNIYKPELWSIRGYVITERWGRVIGYLDKKKRPLPKYIYVWLLKYNY